MSDSGLDAARAPVPVPSKPSGGSWLVRLLRERSVRIAVIGWVAANTLAVAVARGALPFDWPALPGRSASDHLAETNLAILEIFLLMGVVFALTRKRTVPDLAARAPEWAMADALAPHTLGDTPHMVEVFRIVIAVQESPGTEALQATEVTSSCRGHGRSAGGGGRVGT